MSALSEARSLIEQAIGDLDAERSKLERALKELGSTSAPKRRGRPPGKASAPAAPAKRARKRRRRTRKGGTRADQAVALIAEKPGISASQVAKKLKIKPNYLYRVLGDLQKEGRVKKSGKTYSAA